METRKFIWNFLLLAWCLFFSFGALWTAFRSTTTLDFFIYLAVAANLLVLTYHFAKNMFFTKGDIDADLRYLSSCLHCNEVYLFDIYEDIMMCDRVSGKNIRALSEMGIPIFSYLKKKGNNLLSLRAFEEAIHQIAIDFKRKSIKPKK